MKKFMPVHMILLSCVALFVVFTSLPLNNTSLASNTTTPPTSWVTNPANGHKYKLTYSGRWEECESDAVYEGAHLVTINDEDEQNWLIATFGGDEQYFIGFTDKNKERYWEWISGEEVTYTNWYDGEPNNCGGQTIENDDCNDENYAVMNHKSFGKWNDVIGGTARGIIEKSGETATSSPTPAVTASPTPTPTATATSTPYPTPNDSSEVLIFSDDFERSDYTDKWTSGSDCGENTITIVDGYIESTANCNYVETLESFKGDLRIEVDVMKVGHGGMSCWDFFVTLVSPGVTGTIRFDYDDVDGINISTNYDCGDKYTMSSSGVNKGKAVLTYSGSRAWFSFKNEDGAVLETDNIIVSPFIKSKVRISLAALQDSPGYIDNVKIYSLGSTTAPTPTPTRTSTPTPKASPTQAETGTGIIYGFVTEVEGFALKKVSVTLTDSSDYARNTTTDTEGYYEFTDLAADEYTITYEKDGYQTQTKDISLEEEEALDLGTLKMEETEMGSISGYVVDIRGDPVESVKLKLKGIKTKTTVIESSDADGFFEFADLTADNYVITASRKKYKTTRKTVTIEEGEAAEIEIEMRKTTKRRGILLLMRGN